MSAKQPRPTPRSRFQRQSMTRWAAQWYSRNKIDGITRHLIVPFGKEAPKLFRTRAECERWIDAEHGYTKTRQDLRREPHGWRVPRPVMVTVTYQWHPR